MTVMFMYLLGPLFALGLISWVNRAQIRAWLQRRGMRNDQQSGDDKS